MAVARPEPPPRSRRHRRHRSSCRQDAFQPARRACPYRRRPVPSTFQHRSVGKARNRSAGNRIHTQRLVLDDLVGHQFRATWPSIVSRFLEVSIFSMRFLLTVTFTVTGALWPLTVACKVPGLNVDGAVLAGSAACRAVAAPTLKHRSRTRRTNLANTHLSSLSEVEQTNRNV